MTAKRMLTGEYFVLTVQAPRVAALAQPGQFALLRPAAPGVLDPLLARPISIYQCDRASGDVSFLVKIAGRGTALLAELTPGKTITVQGPTGNGFSVPATARRVVLVAGGVGMPPMYFLAETLRRTRPDCAITLCYGGRREEDLLELPAWDALDIPVLAATEDGSRGYAGRVTGPLQDLIARARPDFLAACGPRPMLRAVQALAQEAGLPGQLSLEERMACGVGACLGCVCATIDGRRRICVDGPVFSLEEVVFHA